MKMKANFLYKPSNFQMDDCQIERVLDLPAEEFYPLALCPLEDQPCIAENRDCMFSGDGIIHCLLVLGQGQNDGVLVDSEGYKFARHAAYVPGMRDIVNAELDRAAEFIVRQGTENTPDGIWRVNFEALEKETGLTIREGSGLDIMLLDALKRRPEVAEAELRDGGIGAKANPSTEEKLPDLRLKDILPLLKGVTAFLCHEESETAVSAEDLCRLTEAGRRDYMALFDARVTAIDEGQDGVEVTLTDVAPEELARFNEDYDAFMDAEQAMGPVM